MVKKEKARRAAKYMLHKQGFEGNGRLKTQASTLEHLKEPPKPTTCKHLAVHLDFGNMAMDAFSLGF